MTGLASLGDGSVSGALGVRSVSSGIASAAVLSITPFQRTTRQDTRQELVLRRFAGYVYDIDAN